MSYSPTIENLNDIVSDGSSKSCLTVADAACRLGISRSTLYRAIKRGKVKAVTRGNGVRGIKVSELQRAYSDNTHTKATAIARLSSEGEGSRLAQLEAEVRLSSEHVKILETQLETSKEKRPRKPRKSMTSGPNRHRTCRVSTQGDGGRPTPHTIRERDGVR